MAWKISNFCESTLSQACEAAATTIYIDATDADLLPALGGGDKAKGVLFNATYREIVNITAESAGALTVERGQESTSARAWAAGTKFVHTPTAEILQATLASLAATKFFGTGTGTNAYTVNVGASNPIPTLADGEEVTFLIPNTSTDAAAPTLIVTDGTTPTTSKNILRADGSVPDPAELKSGFLARAIYSTSLNGWLITNLTSRDALIERINLGPIPAINQARNGMLDYWNNGTSFSTPANNTETADGWIVNYDGTIGTFTVSQQAFTLGQTDVEGDPKYFWRWAHTSAGSGSTNRRIQNDIARVHWRGGEAITISVWLKADTNRNVTLKVRQFFGDGGSPSATVDQSDVLAVTTSWQKFSVTKTLDSLSGKTLGSNANDVLRIFLEFPLNVTMTIDVAALDVRPGEVAGQASDTFPLSFQRGGLGGSYDTLTEISNALIALQTDLALVEALSTTGLVYRNNTGPAWGVRSLAVGTGLSVANADATAGNPTVSLGTNLTNYNTDPLSVAELASITGNFGTAAFVNTGTSAATLGLLNANKTDSGINTFSGVNTFTADRGVVLSNAFPRLAWYETDGAVDEKGWQVMVSGGDLTISTRTDADGVGVTALTLNRGTGTALTDIAIGAPLLVPVGSAVAPSLSFSGDANTGMYSPAADQVAFSVGGTQTLNMGTTFATFGVRAYAVDGAAATPAWSFASDTDNGYYRIGANNIGMSIGGVLAVDYSTSRILLGVGQDLRLPDTRVAPSGVNSVGYRGLPTIDGNAAYAFPAADAGCQIYHNEAGTRTYTIPANASVPHPIGTTFVIDNTGNAGAAGAITLAITSDTLRRGDGVAGTGSRTIAASAVATIRKVEATVWSITGVFT